MIRLLTILAALAAVVPAAALAQERLVLAPYPGPPAWKEVTHKVAGLKFLREFIPADQRIEAYRDILTAQSFPEQRGADPARYLNAVFQGAAGACDGVRVNGPKLAREDGHAVAYGQVYCARQKGQAFGVTMLFKVFAGDDSLYVVQREFRTPPQDAPGVMSASPAQSAQLLALVRAQAAADRYLAGQVYLCGTRSADRRCR
ncbi:MAG TPA: hypothetical protein VG939_18455 [Caulobacteraceae bacterium]|nr:hypothetical protein [Caulobacteraceae bacterium]